MREQGCRGKRNKIDLCLKFHLSLLLCDLEKVNYLLSFNCVICKIGITHLAVLLFIGIIDSVCEVLSTWLFPIITLLLVVTK